MRGSQTDADSGKDKIVVIDDPISSMDSSEPFIVSALVRICEGLHCQLEDIMELEEDTPGDETNQKHEQDGEK